MNKIKIMDEILANKIAAGEVVERCASVVKELVENSIDAGSNEIKVELLEAGTRLIKVVDNGSGMEKEDAVLAFNRHATSKIQEEEDLYNINTLGFRGEALASIASVSDIVLKTSTGGVGTLVHIQGGKVLAVENADARVGTSIEVIQLFYNTPARLKHMKSLYTELASITEYMNRLALSHPEIRFTFTNNESVLLKTDGSDNLLKTISSIYGMDVTKKMLSISSENDDYSISGFISAPEVHRSSRNHMITLVNHRVVKNMELNRIINDAYHSYKPDNRYPIVVFDIMVDPSLIDVNIHPTKMDIKFSKMEDLLELISLTIREKLRKQVFIPEVQPLSKPIPMIDSTPISDTIFPIENTKNEKIEPKPVYEEMTLELERVAEEEIPYQESIINDIPEVTSSYERLPELYPIGLVHGTYIICQNDLGMYMIDQHAAKERVNYEYYKKKLGNPSHDRTTMLFPITIELTNNEFLIMKENFSFLEELGFEIEQFGVNSVIIKAHPTWLLKGYEEESIRRILELITQKENNFSIEKFNEKMATMLSCKLAIKANMNISIDEMEALINDLRKCDNPFNCPHGRPTIIFYSNYDLEKLFKRSGFEDLK